MIQHILPILNNLQFIDLYKQKNIPLNKDIYQILKILEKEGFIKIINYSSNNTISFLIIKHFSSIKQISKPSRKIFIKSHHLSSFYKFGLGFFLVRTPKGFLSDKECLWNNKNGELICHIF